VIRGYERSSAQGRSSDWAAPVEPNVWKQQEEPGGDPNAAQPYSRCHYGALHLVRIRRRFDHNARLFPSKAALIMTIL
jgi:hypothetical protein